MEANGNGKNNGDFSFGNVNATARNGLTKIQMYKKMEANGKEKNKGDFNFENVNAAARNGLTKIQTHKKQKEEPWSSKTTERRRSMAVVY